jgi:hypothetical protein
MMNARWTRQSFIEQAHADASLVLRAAAGAAPIAEEEKIHERFVEL